MKLSDKIWNKEISAPIDYIEVNDIKEFIRKLKIKQCLNGSDYTDGEKQYCNQCLCCKEINELAGDKLI